MVKVSSHVEQVEAEEAKRLVEREGHVILDIRPGADYDYQHITKPARISYNWSLEDMEAGVPPPVGVSLRTPLIVMDADGQQGERAAKVLADAQFQAIKRLAGGYVGWQTVWSPSGKRVVSGRWVSTGKEALKSGLDVPGAAESYCEGGDLGQARR